MKSCTNCRYNISDVFCNSPCNGKSLIEGKSETVFLTVARTAEYCGVEAKCFKPLIKPWWKKLWTM
jgi:hypothetical protein